MPASCRLLATNADIRRASHEAHPIVAQTELSDQTRGLRAIIEFPVKTLNIHDERDLYQVDTGPIAFPDWSRESTSMADSLVLAYVAFNVPHFATSLSRTSRRSKRESASQRTCAITSAW